MMAETGIIKEVVEEEDGYSVGLPGSGFFLNKEWGVIPKVGDKITLHLHQGSLIRGVFLNDRKVFYKSDEDLENDHKKWVEEYHRKQEEDYKKYKDKYDEQYQSLPPEFKQRIDNFRKNNERFRYELEPYELFCCTQAVLIANTLKTKEKVLEFSESTDRWNYVPDLDRGHSGNTLGAATQLAYWYLQQPGAIARIPGSLSPLVGSKAYEEKNKRKKLAKHENKNSDTLSD
jgi:hypothetical protein